MSKVIKVEEKVYDQLEALKSGRQTFSDVLENLLKSRHILCQAWDVVEGTLQFREWQREEAAKAQEQLEASTAAYRS